MCDDGKDCTNDSCDAKTGQCVYAFNAKPGCCNPAPLKYDFDSGDLTGWTIANTTTAGVPLPKGQGWQIWSTAPQSKSGKGVLYYGDPIKQNFDMGATKGSAKTPKFQIPAGPDAKLRMWLYYQTEDGGEGSYDDLYVYLYVDGQNLKVWTKSSPDKGANKWIDIAYDLKTYLGKQAELEFYFDTKDSIGNTGLGVIFDDLRIETTCP